MTGGGRLVPSTGGSSSDVAQDNGGWAPDDEEEGRVFRGYDFRRDLGGRVLKGALYFGVDQITSPR